MTGAPWTPEPGAIVFLPEEDEVGYTEDEAYAFLSGGAEAVAELQASAARAFHMAGKHNQKSHAGGAATPGEAAAAARLNSGKTLDLSDPEQTRVAGAIESWSGTHGGVETARVKFEMQEATHDPHADTDGAILLRTTAAAPGDAPTLYRGMKEVHLEDVPGEGDVFSLGPTSFTRSRGVMDEFSQHDSASFGRPTTVHVRLEKGSHSLRIDQQVTGKWKHEQEHITMGRFKVTRRREREVTVKTKDGGKKTVTQIDIDIAQVGDDVPITVGTNAPVISEPGF